MQKADVTALNSLDIRTLRLLALLLETGSITQAGEAFGLSQPAASRIVARLRDVIGDPLIIRSQGRVAFTPRAESLRTQLATALRSIEDALKPDLFDPFASNRKFKIATTDYGAMSVLTPGFASLHRMAPNIQVEAVTWAAGTLENLARGGLDLALYADSDLPPDYRFSDLFTETYAFLMCKNHILQKRSFPVPLRIAQLADFAKFPQLSILYPDDRQLLAENPFAVHKIHARQPVFQTPYFMSAPWILSESDMIMMVPLRVAERMAAAADLAYIEMDAEVGSFRYRMVWHERVHLDAGVRWLRDELGRTLSSTRIASRYSFPRLS